MEIQGDYESKETVTAGHQAPELHVVSALQPVFFEESRVGTRSV